MNFLSNDCKHHQRGDIPCGKSPPFALHLRYGIVSWESLGQKNLERVLQIGIQNIDDKYTGTLQIHFH